MNVEQLKEQTCASLARLHPELADGAAQLVDECFASAARSLLPEFLVRLSPPAWARIAVLYAGSFAETAADVSIGEIFAEVLRDALNIQRMQMLALELAQRKADEAPRPKTPRLALVRKD